MLKVGGSERFVLMALAGALALSNFLSARPPAAPATYDTSDHRPDVRVQPAGRGRSATTPLDIPAPGWKDVLWRVFGAISERRVLANAAGVTFYVLLAIFPGIAALVALYGLFADPATIGQHLDDLASFMPSGATQIISDQVNRLASQGAGKLSLTFLASLAISLWSANAGVKGLFDALNVVYGETERARAGLGRNGDGSPGAAHSRPLRGLSALCFFSWYVQNFGTYNKTYGSLGAVIGFMTWIWLSSIVKLIGGCLNAEMEHQTMHDTTAGDPKPLGARGATVADTLGPFADDWRRPVT